MAQKGPVPKRSEERIRRNVVEPITKVQAIGHVPQPPLGIPDAHHLVEDFYRSLGESAQSKYFEPSDWQFARIVCDYLNRELNFGKRSAQMLANIHTMMQDLLVTEGARRRVRMEVEREFDQGASVTDLAAILKQRAQAG